MDLATFFRIVLRYWWLILLSMLTTVGMAAYVVSKQPKQYLAAAQVQLTANPQLELRQQIDVANVLRDRTAITTLASIARGLQMQETVAKKLNVQVEDIANAELTTAVVPSTSLIDITAQSTDPRFAAAISNTVADELVAQNRGKPILVDVSSRAVAPTDPFRPQPVQTITLAVLFGIVLGVVFALIGYVLRNNWASTPAIEEETEQDNTFVRPRESSAQTQQLYTR